MPSDFPLVSIALVSYQNGPYLKESIEGILNQTYPNIEVIIADDGSTDGSKQIIADYVGKNKQIKVLDGSQNKGVSVNMNNAFDHCNGEYICVIAGDDAMYPQKIEQQVNYLENNRDFDMCFHNVDVYDEDKGMIVYRWLDRFAPTRFPSDALFRASWTFRSDNRKTPSGSWFGRSSYIKNGRNDARTSRYHEFIFTMGMYAAKPGGKWHTIPEVLGKYRVHEKSLSNNKASWQVHAEEISVTFALAAVKFPQYGRKIHNEEAYWWFLQLLYNQVPTGTYNRYTQYFIRNFGIPRYIYLIGCKIFLSKLFSPLRKILK